MRIFVTGVNGQLGHDLMLELHNRGIDAVGSDIADTANTPEVAALPYEKLDITDAAAVNSVLLRIRPDAVIHCAAWTAVDAAEDEANKPTVYAVNVTGTANIAAACKTIGAKMVYISTDYVFDGQGTEPWQPDCQAFAPQNYYGETKLAGERAVVQTLDKFFIVRIAWVFGPNGKNFVKTMLNLGKTHDTLRVVCDQIGTPTYTPDLSRLLADMVQTDKYGYYHATNGGGYISWYDFAVEIFKQAGMAVNVIPVTTAEYGLSKAARPFNSRLNKSKLTANGFTPLPDWQAALTDYLSNALSNIDGHK